MIHSLTEEELEFFVKKTRNKADLLHRENLKKIIELKQRRNILKKRLTYFQSKKEFEKEKMYVRNLEKRINEVKSNYSNYNNKLDLIKQKSKKEIQNEYVEKEYLLEIKKEIEILNQKKVQNKKRMSELKQIINEEIPLDQNCKEFEDFEISENNLEQNIKEIEEESSASEVKVDECPVFEDPIDIKDTYNSEDDFDYYYSIDIENELKEDGLSTTVNQCCDIFDERTTALYECQNIIEDFESDWEERQKDDIETYNIKMNKIKFLMSELHEIDKLNAELSKEKDENLELKVHLDELDSIIKKRNKELKKIISENYFPYQPKKSKDFGEKQSKNNLEEHFISSKFSSFKEEETSSLINEEKEFSNDSFAEENLVENSTKSSLIKEKEDNISEKQSDDISMHTSTYSDKLSQEEFSYEEYNKNSSLSLSPIRESSSLKEGEGDFLLKTIKKEEKVEDDDIYTKHVIKKTDYHREEKSTVIKKTKALFDEFEDLTQSFTLDNSFSDYSFSTKKKDIHSFIFTDDQEKEIDAAINGAKSAIDIPLNKPTIK